MFGLFESCLSAGPDLCALASPYAPNLTASNLLTAFNTALTLLLNDPLPAGSLTTAVRVPGPATSLYTGIKGTVFGQLYHATQYPVTAALLAPILSQNTSYIESLSVPLPSEALPTTTAEPWNLGLPNAFWGIACSDASFRASSPSEMLDKVQAQNQSSGFSDAFSGSVWPCSQWKFQPAERYEGSFGNETHQISTQFPIMFVNGEYDPATPHASAVRASQGFAGSRLLTHGGHGHKFFRHPSTCTTEAVRAYFVNGTLPEEGAYCEPDVNAFEVMLTGGPGANSQVPQNIT